MPKFEKNPDGMKPSGYKMKYQGSPSAFPFKSPLKQEITKVTDDSGNVIKSSDVSVEDQIAQAEARFGEGVNVKMSKHKTTRDNLAHQAYVGMDTSGAPGMSLGTTSQGVRSLAYKHADKLMKDLNIPNFPVTS